VSIGSDRDRSRIEPDPKDWLLDADDFAELMDDISQVKVNSDYDVPYTAGYSEDGQTIYIDSQVPKTIRVRKTNDRLNFIEVDLYKSFTVHEMAEKSLEASPYFWKYSIAHEAALRLERLYVESTGADWNDYNEQTLRIVDEILNRAKYPNCPPDLDIGPYIDCDDDDTLAKMKSENGRDFDAEEDEENAGKPGTDDENEEPDNDEDDS